jgi:site-specific recombinase XerD
MDKPAPSLRKPKLLEQVRRSARARHLSRRTEEAYIRWIHAFVRHQGLRHPEQLGAEHVTDFLVHVANERGVSPSTQRQAASALRFLYEQVLERPIDVDRGITGPARRHRLPVVLTKEEVRELLHELHGVKRLG